MTFLRIRKHLPKLDAAILINPEALAEYPVGVVKEALDVMERKMIQDGRGNLYIVRKEAA